MTLLLWLGRRYQDKLLNGDLFLIYVLFYAFGRFWLEFLRLDTAPVAGYQFQPDVYGCAFRGLLGGADHSARYREPETADKLIQAVDVLKTSQPSGGFY